MRHGFFLCILLFLYYGLHAQQPPTVFPAAALKQRLTSSTQTTGIKQQTAVEICDNGIDDDHNRLVDLKDYACYFQQSLTSTECMPSPIVWTCTNSGLMWADMSTGRERIVGDLGGNIMTDIAWASNGKLYGIPWFAYFDTFEGIWEIDPLTSLPTRVAVLQDYVTNNALVGDANGNLYLTAILRATEHRQVLKFNLATHAVSLIVDLTEQELTSAGDLTFLDGYLYLTCKEGKILKIDLATQTQTLSTIENDACGMNMGMITLGDHYLYITCDNQIYKLDPVTMQAESRPFFRYRTPNIQIWGLSNYSDQCNAPGCKARVYIQNETPPPYCATAGVHLKAFGSGITGASGITWTLPGGGTATGATITATTSGTYRVRYHTLPDTCGQEDSMQLQIIPDPNPGLARDTILCAGATLRLTPSNTAYIKTYLWQDGTTQPEYQVTKPGTYMLETANMCASHRDTVVVHGLKRPQVLLGSDTAVCPGAVLDLANKLVRQPEDQYLWSTGATNETLQVPTPSLYWLEATNSCGKSRDSILFTFKDSCTCFPLYPKVRLGNDQQLCSYDTLVLSNQLHESRFHYRWQNGWDGPSLTVKKPGLYVLEVRTYCGAVRDSVLVESKTEGCECHLFVPTAFTPNGDGKNDVFRTTADCPVELTLQVFNRWGQLVFTTNDPFQGWNGLYKGSAQKSDTYVFTVTYRFKNRPGVFTRKGTLLLIR